MPPDIEIGRVGWRTSATENQSIFEQHKPDRHGSTELRSGRAKAAMDNVHTNDCGWIPVSQDLQKHPRGWV